MFKNLIIELKSYIRGWKQISFPIELDSNIYTNLILVNINLNLFNLKRV